MDSCNGIPITPEAIKRTEHNLLTLFHAAKTDGMFSDDAKLVTGKFNHYISIEPAIFDGPIVRANPKALSCTTYTGLQGAMAHESGHQDLWQYGEIHGLSQGFIFIFALLATQKCLKYWYDAARNKRPSAWRRAKISSRFLAGFIALHSANGVVNVHLARYDEKRADAYSAQILNSGAPFASWIEQINRVRIDRSELVPIPWEKYSRVLKFGLIGYFMKTHPDDDQRIQALRAYRPVDPAVLRNKYPNFTASR